jgi:hypothetical protein
LRAWLLFLGSGRTAADSREVVRAFADHLNRVLNTTVSKSRLTVLVDPSSERRFVIARLVNRRIAPLDLNGSRAKLLLQQNVEVVEDDAPHVNTLTYMYRYQLHDDPKSWLFRWEYFRKRPKDDYPYPLAHFHVNAATGEFPDLQHKHFATRRVPLELVLWTLLAEWNVRPLENGWEPTLQESIDGFDERRTAN